MTKLIRYEVEGYYPKRGQFDLPMKKREREWKLWRHADTAEDAQEYFDMGMGKKRTALGFLKPTINSDAFSKLRIVEVHEERKVIAGDVE